MELDESLTDAALRELMEETGVRAEALGPVDVVKLRETDPQERFHHFILVAMLCRYFSGELIAGDDAADCRWLKVPEELYQFDGALADHVARVALKAHGTVTQISFW